MPPDEPGSPPPGGFLTREDRPPVFAVVLFLLEFCAGKFNELRSLLGEKFGCSLLLRFLLVCDELSFNSGTLLILFNKTLGEVGILLSLTLRFVFFFLSLLLFEFVSTFTDFFSFLDRSVEEDSRLDSLTVEYFSSSSSCLLHFFCLPVPEGPGNSDVSEVSVVLCLLCFLSLSFITTCTLVFSITFDAVLPTEVLSEVSGCFVVLSLLLFLSTGSDVALKEKKEIFFYAISFLLT